MRIGILGALVISLSEIYQFVTVGGVSRQLLGILLTLGAIAMSWLATVHLARQRKLALPLLLGALALGIFRWVVVDQAFALTIPSLLLIALFTCFIAQFVYWVRIGVLN